MERKRSTIINIRSFHNWIKTRLIQESVLYLKENSVDNLSLLDLAVGRGGDMGKWYRNGIYNVVGIDIDEPSIKGKNGAIHRFKRLIRQTRKKLNYHFYIFDLSDPKNTPTIDKIIRGRKFGIVSCQFAIHYFFREKQALETLLSTVSKNMVKGGVFIGTTMDGSIVEDYLSKNNPYQNSVFYLKSKHDSGSTYGRTYEVQLGERGEEHYFAQKPSIEYMVDQQELINMCDKFGLHFVASTPFSEWYKEYQKEPNINQISSDEKEFSFINFSFFFIKK